MTPQDTYRRRTSNYILALVVYCAVVAFGISWWLGPGRHPEWMSTLPGEVLLAAWALGLAVYFVAVTRMRCPRCGTRIRVFDLGGLDNYALRSYRPAFCQGCGLNLGEEWPPRDQQPISG
jgi:hypothetical protein